MSALNARPRPPDGMMWMTGAVAVLAALVVGYATDFEMVRAYRRLVVANPVEVRRLPAARRLILEGDPARPTRAARQRAIWEAAPDRTVYFQNYLTYLLADAAETRTNAEAVYTQLAAEAETGRALDPDNARLDFILAGKLLEQAVQSKTSVTGVSADGKAKVRSEQVIKDRARLMTAMELLRRGLAKPAFRRQIREMLAERLAALGPPRSLSDQMLQLSLAADLPLPDLSLMRNLSRGAAAYAALLIGEGRNKEALPFLEAWKGLTLKLTGDSFALVDVLMAAAIVKEAELRIPELYEQIGMTREAGAARKEMRALTAPMVVWNTRRNAFQTDADARRRRDAFVKHAGILPAMLLPALTDYPSTVELAPSRWLDYLLIDDLGFSVLAMLMAAAGLAGAIWLVLAARARASGGGSASALCMTALIKTIWCVGFPVAAYFILTRWSPFGGRVYGLPYAWPRTVVQWEVLAGSMALMHVIGSSAGFWPGRAVPGRRWPCLAGLLLAAGVGVGFLAPVGWLSAQRQTVSLAAMTIPVALLVILSAARGLALRRERRRAPGDTGGGGLHLAVLTLSCCSLALTLGARGIVRSEERRWVQRESLLKVDPSLGGFTAAEARMARDLRDQILKAAE